MLEEDIQQFKRYNKGQNEDVSMAFMLSPWSRVLAVNVRITQIFKKSPKHK
jgi:hypothetical protein